ncbi:hypothetical protein CDAR_540281 [Caerostris darwini]|uniref:Uncharacterized protein n=1 Tax=Caerostris darwini TaxID=1538125 RepID=A0AAV4WTC8_9ARAC|nr:hypothetical protein CDAR_540281 [Caerostris darwini]
MDSSTTRKSTTNVEVEPTATMSNPVKLEDGFNIILSPPTLFNPQASFKLMDSSTTRKSTTNVEVEPTATMSNPVKLGDGFNIIFSPPPSSTPRVRSSK